MLAHVGGVPLEELVPALAAGTGGCLVLLRAQLTRFLGRQRRPG